MDNSCRSNQVFGDACQKLFSELFIFNGRLGINLILKSWVVNAGFVDVNRLRCRNYSKSVEDRMAMCRYLGFDCNRDYLCANE